MGRQFENVSGAYGAPMGRHSVGHLDLSPRSVRLFRVRLDAGGYDDGGAYWGHGAPLWCAEDRDGDRQFIRAATRNAAAFSLGIPAPALRAPLAGMVEYAYAMLDGRCPIPEGKDRVDVTNWVEDSGAATGNPYVWEEPDNA